MPILYIEGFLDNKVNICRALFEAAADSPEGKEIRERFLAFHAYAPGVLKPMHDIDIGLTLTLSPKRVREMGYLEVEWGFFEDDNLIDVSFYEWKYRISAKSALDKKGFVCKYIRKNSNLKNPPLMSKAKNEEERKDVNPVMPKNKIISIYKKLIANLFIIFLDIDGVLLDPGVSEIISISQADSTPEVRKKMRVNFFDFDALENLNHLIEKIEKHGLQVGIVISSAWRTGRSIEELKSMFEQHSFSSKIIDKTADAISIVDGSFRFPLDRAEEIEAWLQSKRQALGVVGFLILDDRKFSFPELFPKNFAQCRRNTYGPKAFKKSRKLFKTMRTQKAVVDDSPSIPLENKVIVEIKDEKEKKLEGLSMRVSSQTRRKFVTLFSKKELSFPAECSKLIAEYDQPQVQEIKLNSKKLKR